jgi:hypothetical protein
VRLFGYDIIIRKHNKKFLNDVDEYINSIDVLMDSIKIMKKQFVDINSTFSKNVEWDSQLINYLNRDREFFDTRIKHILENNALYVSTCVQHIVNLLLQCSASHSILTTLPDNECTPPSLFIASINVLKSLKLTGDKCSNEFQKFANGCSNLMGVYCEMTMHGTFGQLLQETETPDGINEYYEMMLTSYFNEVTKHYDNLVIEINKMLISLGTYNNLFLSESINIKKDKQDFINLVCERNKEHKIPSDEDKLYTTTIYRSNPKELSKEENDFLEYMKNKAKKEGKK